MKEFDDNRPRGGPGLDISLYAWIWRKAVDRLNVERLLPRREKRFKNLAQKLDKTLDCNGGRIFVSGQSYRCHQALRFPWWRR